MRDPYWWPQRIATGALYVQAGHPARNIQGPMTEAARSHTDLTDALQRKVSISQNTNTPRRTAATRSERLHPLHVILVRTSILMEY